MSSEIKYEVPSQLASLSVPIMESIQTNQIENFQHYNIRYYDDKYALNFINKKTESNEHDDMLIRVHSNKILLIALAQGNSIMESPKDVAEIDFVVNNSDRSVIKTRGKRKLGARALSPETALCKVRLEGEDQFRCIRAGIKGFLVEINELVKQNPKLIKTDPKGLGFIGVVMPQGPNHALDKAVENMALLDEKDYHKHLRERKTAWKDVSLGHPNEILNDNFIS